MVTATSTERTDRVRARARALGFDAVGIARADEPLDEDVSRWRAFVDAGMHGSMDWLADDAELRTRVDGAGGLAGAKSVVVVARRYRRDDDAHDPELARGIARYARGQDYHNFLRKRLRRLAAYLRTLAPGTEARPMIDDAPLLERAWAARAGLGFVGKNGMIILPGIGSMVLLGEVITTLALVPDAPMSEKCGTCTRCLDACPTNAFARPFVLDARRCVSYLTIEHRGASPVEVRAQIGEHLFGCDDCQTVCPFNRGLETTTRAARAFAPLDRWSTLTLEALLAMSDDEWATLAEGTPLHRAGRAGLARNAAVVLGNRKDVRALPALRLAAETHEDETVRDAARWAVSVIENAAHE